MVLKPNLNHGASLQGEYSHQPATLPPLESSKSFWHTEPSGFLLGHRTTPDLPTEADVVIIGSGITGTSAARYLLEDNQDGSPSSSEFKNVVMLEAREACWGATGRNGGHLQPLLFDRHADVAAFELQNCADVAAYIRQHKIPCEYRAVSGCRTFWTEHLYAEARDAVLKLQKEHPDVGAKVQAIDGNEREELQKHWVKDGCAGITVTEGAASLWPYKYVTWVLEHLVKERGLNLQTNTPVTSIKESTTFARRKDTHVSNSCNERSTWEIVTERGTIITQNVILATNGHTTHLLPHLADLMIPVRGTMTALLPPPSQGATLLPNSYGFVGAGKAHDPGSDEYLVQRPYHGVRNAKGHLMYGGGREAGDLPTRNMSDDGPVDPGSVHFLQESLPRGLSLGDGDEKPLDLEMAWSGIMCFSRDNCPWVGQVPNMRGVWLCAAYTGHGMPNATLCAKACVEMVRKTEEDGVSAAEAGRVLVEGGRLPKSYLMTETRMKLARQLPSVEEQDIKGIACFVDVDTL